MSHYHQRCKIAVIELYLLVHNLRGRASLFHVYGSRYSGHQSRHSSKAGLGKLNLGIASRRINRDALNLESKDTIAVWYWLHFYEYGSIICLNAVNMLMQNNSTVFIHRLWNWYNPTDVKWKTQCHCALFPFIWLLGLPLHNIFSLIHKTINHNHKTNSALLFLPYAYQSII